MAANSKITNQLPAQYSPYLSEARKKFLKILLFFVVGLMAGMAYYQQILNWLIGVFKLDGVNLVLTSPFQFIGLAVTTGLVTGFALCFPLFIYYLLDFVKPALSVKEFRLVSRLMPISIMLFVTGFIVGIWVVQFVIDLFSSTSTGFQLENIWDLSSFLSQILLAGISLALIFQLPVVLTILIRLKIISLQAVKDKRKVIYSVLLIAGAFFSPGADMFTFVIFTLASLFLFEITLLFNQ
ncbi:MAG TPA: twin-arginine translocase subunit TatC [Patescibacteria group bacterium]|jgi:sec-independent protein translocase protein TatC